MWLAVPCCHKPKFKNDIFICLFGSKSHKEKTNETVKQELLNSLKENDNLEKHQVLMKQQMR